MWYDISHNYELHIRKLPKFPSTCELINSMVIGKTKRNKNLTFYKVVENSVLSYSSEDCVTKPNGAVSIS
jgi:hypothetical protein